MTYNSTKCNRKCIPVILITFYKLCYFSPLFSLQYKENLGKLPVIIFKYLFAKIKVKGIMSKNDFRRCQGAKMTIPRFAKKIW